MRDLAVICASPPGVNPGMASVDRALLEVADRHRFVDRVALFRIVPGACATIHHAGQAYSYSQIPDGRQWTDRFAAILYWGDFLHMRHYQTAVAQTLLSAGFCADREQALGRVQEVFLLRDHASDVLARTMSFGTTLLVNSISDDTHPAYGPLLRRFLRECHDVRCRDVFSAFRVSSVRDTSFESSLGVDCALLADPARVPTAEPVSGRLPRLGLHLARTGHRSYVESMVAFARELAECLSATPSWLAWGDRAAFPALTTALAVEDLRTVDGFSESCVSEPAGALAGLRAYSAIVTDTYHVCVNAWNLGVPAVCVAQTAFSDVRDMRVANYFSRLDKRYVFLAMYHGLDFFVPTNELEAPRQRRARVAHLARLLKSGEVCAAIHARLRRHAGEVEQRFISVLRPLLDSPSAPPVTVR